VKHNRQILFSAISVAQCLLVISEDNSSAWRTLTNFESNFQNLLNVDGDFQKIMLRTCISGIMSNVPALLMQNSCKIIEALGKTIEVNHRVVLNEITSKLPLGEKDPSIEIIDEEMVEESESDASLRRLQEEQPSDLEQEVKLIGYLLSSQRMAAEILSNICTPDDDENYEDIDDKSDVESVHDYDTTAQSNQTPMIAYRVPIEVSETIKSCQIVEKVSSRACSFLPSPQEVSRLIIDYRTVTRYTCGRLTCELRYSSCCFRSDCFSSGISRRSNLADVSREFVEAFSFQTSTLVLKQTLLVTSINFE
jgi:HEAT repeat-containing protein 3